MDRRTWLGAIAITSLLMTGCAPRAGDIGPAPDPQASHSMPDGSVMSGSEHGAHAGEHQGEHQDEAGPSDAALMVCGGQVREALSAIFELEGGPAPSASWDDPVFTCTYDIGGAPLILSVHDATDVQQGRHHFADLQKSLPHAEEIQGLAGLGMPSFSTDDGMVAFLRDGKTLLVDATALPSELGVDGLRDRQHVAYSAASAVLACWVEHD